VWCRDDRAGVGQAARLQQVRQSQRELYRERDLVGIVVKAEVIR